MEQQHTPSSERRVLSIIVCVVFLAVMSGTMVNVSLPIVGQHFQTTESVYGWLVTGFTLTFALFSAVHGRLADNYGSRRLYLIGLTLFSILAVFIAASPSIELMIGLRVLQGAGAAAMPALGTVIISRVFPETRRGRAMGYILGTVGFAASIGPFFGGAIAQWVGWRAVFLFPALGLVLLPLGRRWLPKHLDEVTPKPIDILGACLLTASSTALMWVPSSIKSYGWSVPTWCALGLGLLFGMAFLVRVQTTRHPFLPPHLFRINAYRMSLLVAFLAQATRFGTVVLIPILLLNVHQLTPIQVGFCLCPGAICIAILSPQMGAWSDRIGTIIPVALGLTAMLAGNIITVATCGSSTIGVTVGITLYGVGFAAIQSPMVNGVSRQLPKPVLGIGLGMFMMTFFLGGAFGVAISMVAIDIQQPETASWLGLELGEGGRFSNAMLCLTGLGLLALALVTHLPGAPQKAQAPTA